MTGSASIVDNPEDVEASAEGMIRNFGSRALDKALCEVGRMKAEGSEAGTLQWQAIAAAIAKLEPKTEE